MKKVFAMLLLSSAISMPVLAQVQEPIVSTTQSVSNTQVVLHESKIIMAHGSMYTPVRVVTDALGLQLKWNKDTQHATITTPELSATVQANRSEYTLDNGSSLTLHTPTILEKGVLYVPIEFWVEAFDYYVVTQNNGVSIDVVNPNLIYDDIMTPLYEGTNTLYTNQKASIQLEQNSSTGYVWEVDFPDNIKIISDTVSSGDPNLVGAPETRTWILKATRPGTYDITFNYKRPFENKIEKSVTYQLMVNDFVIPN